MDQLSTRTINLVATCFGAFGVMWLFAFVGSCQPGVPTRWGLFFFGLPPVAIAAYLGREAMRRRAAEANDSDARLAVATDPVEAMSPVTRATLTEVADAAFELATPSTSRIAVDIEPLRSASGT